MYIKNFKKFTESSTQKLYLDSDYIYQSYFISFYDEDYDFKLTKGWIDDKNDFRIISPGNNRKLGYEIRLNNTNESIIDLDDKLTQAKEIFEFDGFKMEVLNKDWESVDILLISNDIRDITIDDVCREYPFLTKDIYLKGYEFLKNEIDNANFEIINNAKEWYNKNGDWIIKKHKKYNTYYLRNDIIWSYYVKNFNFSYEQIEIFTNILLDNILNCKVFTDGQFL